MSKGLRPSYQLSAISYQLLAISQSVGALNSHAPEDHAYSVSGDVRAIATMSHSAPFTKRKLHKLIADS